MSQNKTTSSTEVLLYDRCPDEEQLLLNTLVGQGYHVTDISSDEIIPPFTPNLIAISSDDAEECHKICKQMKVTKQTEDSPILIISDNEHIIEQLSGLSGAFDLANRSCQRETLIRRTRTLIKIQELGKQLDETRQQLLESQKMESVGALAAGVAHEFNNLMCAVMGFAEMARSDGGMNIEALRESAEISYQTAKRASTTAESLLAFSRKTRNLAIVSDINDAAEAAIRLLRRNIEKSGVKIVYSPEELPLTRFIFGSIQQVFLNLIINAWHATSETDGEKAIHISTSCIDNTRIQLKVSDTGKGIAEEDMKNIFDPFFTTKSGDSDGDAKGSGLGLVVVHEVIRNLNGTLNVESKLGQGTCFTILLPVETEKQKDAQEAPINDTLSEIDATKYSVLIIDDEEENRRVISRLLMRKGHEAFSAANMAEALPLLWGKKIDVIVMDLVMPEVSGVELIKQIREEEFEMPILICTGQMDTESIKQGLDNGANGVVTKPFSATEFLEEMHNCIKVPA